MALQVLKGIEKIGGFPIVVMDDLRAKFPEKFNESGAMDYKWFETDIRPKYHVYVRNDVNSISFTLQDGPIKEVGVNGCQVDTMIEAARQIIKRLNLSHPCQENEAAIVHLNAALASLELRKKNREAAGIEGTNMAKHDYNSLPSVVANVNDTAGKDFEHNLMENPHATDTTEPKKKRKKKA